MDTTEASLSFFYLLSQVFEATPELIGGGRRIVIDEQEAETVRYIFRRYQELGCVRLLKEDLDRRSVVSKRRTSKTGIASGGHSFSRGALYALLSNPIYVGEIRHKKRRHRLNVADYHAEWNVPEFRRRLACNLYQDLDGLEFPFLLLDREFRWHPGFRWWERKLRDVATILARTRYPGRYRDAFCELSNRIAA